MTGYYLPGSAALPGFRLGKALARLRRELPAITDAAAWAAYFVDAAAPLDEEELAALARLLDAFPPGRDLRVRLRGAFPRGGARRECRIRGAPHRDLRVPGSPPPRQGPGHPSGGDDLAVVEQGDRHRPQLRLRSGAPRGARHPLDPFRGERPHRRGARDPPRPHDRARLAPRRTGGPGPAVRGLRPGPRGAPGTLPRHPAGAARPDLPPPPAGTRPSRRGSAARARPERGRGPVAPRPIRRARPGIRPTPSS